MCCPLPNLRNVVLSLPRLRSCSLAARATQWRLEPTQSLFPFCVPCSRDPFRLLQRGLLRLDPRQIRQARKRCFFLWNSCPPKSKPLLQAVKFEVLNLGDGPASG